MELLVVVTILGLVTLAIGVSWQNSRGRVDLTSAARLTKTLIHQARMSSIYEGVNHFVVIDPDNRLVEIYADTGATPGSFDNADPRVGGTHLESSIALALPSEPSSLSSPLDASSVSDAWSLPLPDSGARWGTKLRGLMATPTGLLRSAEATPQTIGSGLIVFSNDKNNTVAIGIRGREGSVRSFEWFDAKWKEL